MIEAYRTNWAVIVYCDEEGPGCWVSSETEVDASDADYEDEAWEAAAKEFVSDGWVIDGVGPEYKHYCGECGNAAKAK